MGAFGSLSPFRGEGARLNQREISPGLSQVPPRISHVVKARIDLDAALRTIAA